MRSLAEMAARCVVEDDLGSTDKDLAWWSLRRRARRRAHTRPCACSSFAARAAPTSRGRPCGRCRGDRVDFVLLPEVLLEPLNPLEVRDDDTPGIGEDVREDDDTAILEDVVRCRRRRAVRAFDDDLRPHLVRVVGRDHLLERTRCEHVALEDDQLLVRHRLGSLKAGERAGLVLEGDRGRNVDATGVVDASGRIGDRDHLGALLVARSAKKLPTLPKPWTATLIPARSWPGARALRAMRRGRRGPWLPACLMSHRLRAACR